MLSQSDDEDEEFQEAKWLGKDGIIFMIDATKHMFSEDELGESAFRMCLKGCDAAMQHKIMFSSSDLMSIVLFGTDASKNDNNLSHITVLQELQRPDASTYKQLRKIHESKNYDDIDSKYGSNEDYLFADLLWLGHLMFGKTTTKLATSRILLLTCSEVLGKNDPQSKRQAVTRAKDLRGDAITFEVIPCSVNYQPSDFLKTLMNIVEGTSGTWSLPPSHCISSLADIPKVIEKIAASKDQRSRCLGHIPFKIGEGLKINVEVYNLVRQTSMPSKTLLSRVTNEVVKSSVQHYKCTTSEVVVQPEAGSSQHQLEETVKLEMDSKELLMKFDMAKSINIGGERVQFTQEEFKTMRKLMDPGLTLLGFIPVSLLKKTHHCSPASFVYPDKLSTQGARDLFTALWLRTGAKNKAAICSYVLRVGMAPRFAALIPAGMDQSEKIKLYQKHGIHTLPDPQGFHLIILPYSDYVNSLGLPESPSAYPRQIDCAIGVLKKLRVIFHSSSFPNPAIDTHWAAIEAIALDRPAPRDVVDEISPDYPVMDSRIGALADEFLETVYEAGYDPTKNPSKSAHEKPASSIKQDINLVEAAKANRKVANLTADTLRTYLRAMGKPVAGKKKAELVADVYALDG